MAYKVGSAIFSGSGYSIKYDMAFDDHLPTITHNLAGKTIDALKQAADEAIQEVANITPYDPNSNHPGPHLKDSAYSAAYRLGPQAGTVRITWTAKSNTSQKWPDFHYGIAQNQGGADGVRYQNYSTPGTGPGFMDKAWSYIYTNVQRILVTQKLLED